MLAQQLKRLASQHVEGDCGTESAGKSKCFNIQQGFTRFYTWLFILVFIFSIVYSKSFTKRMKCFFLLLDGQAMLVLFFLTSLELFEFFDSCLS